MARIASIEEFTDALSKVSDFAVTDTAREQANKCVKEGNVYFAALLRELANRVESSHVSDPKTYIHKMVRLDVDAQISDGLVSLCGLVNVPASTTVDALVTCPTCQYALTR